MQYIITKKMINQNRMGPDPIKLLKWNLAEVDIFPGSTILDLGSGKGLTSVYLANEFDSNVMAYDKGIHPNDSRKTMRKCNPQKMPIPLRGDARELPFAHEYFDFVIATDLYIYYGTDDLYFPYISQFLKSGGFLCFTVPGFNKDVAGDSDLPDHLRPFWADECWTWHTKEWWKSHVERTGHFEVVKCEQMQDSYDFWLEETRQGPAAWRKNDLPVIESDRGEYMGFIKVVARKKNEASA